jgi:hypothetical protein
MDHVAYQRQRHKQCAFNLYAAAAMEHALAPLCRAFEHATQAEAAAQFGRELLAAAVRAFWSTDRGLFVNNLPWPSEEKTPRTCDRSLATAILYDQCPGGQTSAAVRSLAECPAEMGLSYPCNAGWRLWALAKCGRADVIVSDLRQRWATMRSVKENNTLQEDWTANPDCGNEWSHCDVVPIYIAHQGLMGLTPSEPGFKRFKLRPQLADLRELELVAYTMRGPLRLRARGGRGEREVTLDLPATGKGDLILPQGESVDLPEAKAYAPPGHRRFSLPEGGTVKLRLREV